MNWPDKLTQHVRELLAVGCICFCAGGLYGWSALNAPLQATFGVTTAQTGFVFSLAIVSFTAAVIIVPRCLNPKAMFRSTPYFGLASAVFITIATQMQTYEYFLLWFSGGFGATSGAIYIVALSIASESPFHRISTPSMVAAFGTGGAFFGPIWRILGHQNWGLESLAILASCLFVFSIFAATITLKETLPATESSTTPYQTEDVSELQKPGIMLAMIWLAFAFGSFGGLMILGLASKILDFSEVSVAVASITLAGIAIGNTIGRLSVAYLISCLRLEQCLYSAMGLTLIGITLTISTSNSYFLGFGLIFIATGYGVVASAAPVLTRTAFGVTEFQKKFALVFSAWGVSGFVAPWAGGAMFDKSGSFFMPLFCAFMTASICALISWRLGIRLRIEKRI